LLVLACPATSEPARDPTVILLSFDGVRHDQPDRDTFESLARMEREGARAERLRTVFPSTTFPGHVSLATGTHPDRHGIVANRFLDRTRGPFDPSDAAAWIRAEPLWIAAERQGVRSATFFWLGSTTDWQGARQHHRVAPFDAEVGEAQKVERILAWLDLPTDERPRLIMSWWHGSDRAGHRYGPNARAVAAALHEQDAHLEALLAGLDARNAWSHTTLLVVSDHGMTEWRSSLPVEPSLADANVAARVVSSGPVAHVWIDDPARIDAAIEALSGLDGVRVHRAGALPAELRYDVPERTGDLVLLAQPPHSFGSARPLVRMARWFGLVQGMHGYPPDHPDMGGIFYALGRGVAAGTRLGEVRAIDVAATASGLLGIEPPRDSEGAAIPGIGVATSEHQGILEEGLVDVVPQLEQGGVEGPRDLGGQRRVGTANAFLHRADLRGQR
jgi:predicted AlkP superfamily pyrophosphatase or phosphodiesterase